MAIKQYLQVGTDESFYLIEADTYALIVNQYGADVLIKSGNVYLNDDLLFYDTTTALLSYDGAIYLPIGKSVTPTVPSYLLLEDGSYILLETGDKILLQRQR